MVFRKVGTLGPLLGLFHHIGTVGTLPHQPETQYPSASCRKPRLKQKKTYQPKAVKDEASAGCAISHPWRTEGWSVQTINQGKRHEFVHLSIERSYSCAIVNSAKESISLFRYCKNPEEGALWVFYAFFARWLIPSSNCTLSIPIQLNH